MTEADRTRKVTAVPPAPRKLASGPSCRAVPTSSRRLSRLRTSTGLFCGCRRARASDAVVARYYDPTTAQFLTRDPLESETGQPYSYAGDDPIDNSDPSGLHWWNSAYDWTVENLDPVSYALPFYYNEAQAAENGCSLSTVVKYGAEGVVVLGLGGLGPEDDAIPFAEGNLEHIFRDEAGHFAEDTAENRTLIQSLIKPQNYVRTGGGGEHLYRETLPDGTQVWAKVFNGKITNGGLNQTPLP
jgi:RHS repeat-associated protein